MLEFIKKMFNILMKNSAFVELFKKSAQTGRIDPLDALSALTSVSDSTRKCAGDALNTVQRGGGIPDVAKTLTNFGDIDVSAITGNKGQVINTKNIARDLRNVGDPDSISRKFGIGLANAFEHMSNQAPESVVEFGDAAGNINNWQDIVSK